MAMGSALVLTVSGILEEKNNADLHLVSPRKNSITPSTSSRQERASFASFKEDRQDIAQSFIDSRNSTLAGASEEAIDDSTSRLNKDIMCRFLAAEDPNMSITNLGPVLYAFTCPCCGFQGWIDVSVSNKTASASFDTWDPVPKNEHQARANYPAGEAPLESLPVELFGTIIGQLVEDVSISGVRSRNSDLMSLLLTSRTLYSATLDILYKHVMIPRSNAFRKFLNGIEIRPEFGLMVRRLDFSHFNPTGAGMTARERAETQNLTNHTLLQCLNLLPNLREFLAQEHIDEDLSADVIRNLLEMPSLQALDLCACSSTQFRDAVMTVIRSPSGMDLPQILPITRLSLHECTILPSTVFESLLPRLPQLTHLDLTHTRVKDEALASIPETARITHLNLSKCSSLSGDKTVEFLGGHPAVKGLIYLNLLMDAKSHEMLSDADVTALLPVLPATLRSLNLKGSKMSPNHIPLLLPLTKHVEELGVGRNLPYKELTSVLWQPVDSYGGQKAIWVPHTLRYLDISDLEVNELDLGLVFGTRTSPLKDWSLPLEVIEVGQNVYDKFKVREHICEQFGWAVKEAGRRGWLVRDKTKMKASGTRSLEVDDGTRKWKMGATCWGMRKVPVAQAEVGGMYGLYMFKR